MNIGIDISQIVYQTGVSRYTKELVTHLTKLAPEHNYFLYGGSLRKKQTLESFVSNLNSPQVTSRITSLSPRLADLLWNKLSIFSPTLKKDLDIFHASNWALPRVNSKLVTTIHDLSFIKHPKTHLPSLVAAHTRHLNRSKDFADLVITDANSTKKDLVEYGLNPDKIKVIHLASSSVFQPQTNKAKTTATLNKYQLTTPYILSVGSLNPRKNLKKLIQSDTDLNLQSQLVLVGKFGWCEELKETRGVKLLGFVPDTDLVNLYSAAKAFVYPSLYEGFGLPILEAMSCGCPVITSNVSSLPEVGGSAATYINPNSSKDISQAIQHHLKLNDLNHLTLVKKSLAQAKKFSWEKTAKQTLQAYQLLLK